MPSRSSPYPPSPSLQLAPTPPTATTTSHTQDYTTLSTATHTTHRPSPHANSPHTQARKNPPIRHIALILRPKSPTLEQAANRVIALFKEAHIRVSVLKEYANTLALPPHVGIIDSVTQADILVSLGGDGTLISAVRKSLGHAIPVLGINLGRLGFLTAIKPSELEQFLPLLLEGSYALDSHRLLQGTLTSHHTQSAPFYVLNEILITKKDISGMTRIYATINDEHFHTYRADGLIIATPTGSSAYNISAGGSIVHPRCRVILLTPVCAHSLTQRPMIISDDFSLQFSVGEDSMIMLDGQERVEFFKGDELIVKAQASIQLIQHPKRSYFALMEEKFGLGGDMQKDAT